VSPKTDIVILGKAAEPGAKTVRPAGMFFVAGPQAVAEVV
jgi:hypothetical protein